MYLSVYDGGRGGLRIVPEGQGEAVRGTVVIINTLVTYLVSVRVSSPFSGLSMSVGRG
jgi:hypothetical protein